MERVELQLYVQPGSAEVFVNALRVDGGLETFAAVVDTGAEFSLFPEKLRSEIQYRLVEELEVEQAGIARQAFKATVGIVQISLEDMVGGQTQLFEIPVWFAETRQPLIGFAGVLDRSVLHIDMLQRQGWIAIDDSSGVSTANTP